MVDNSVGELPWWCDKDWASEYVEPGKPGSRMYWIRALEFPDMIQDNWNKDQYGVQGVLCTTTYDLDIGDTVRLREESHALIISDIKDFDKDWITDFNEIFVCAHTNNVKDYKLESLNSDPEHWNYYKIKRFKRPEMPDTDGDGDYSDALDTDWDGLPDYCDTDDDGDGIESDEENSDPNSDGDPWDSQDTDEDGIPDYLDDDDDDDGILTLFEWEGYNTLTTDHFDNVILKDTDNDGIPDHLDDDDDGDGVKTYNENPDPNGDGNPKDAFDTDGDGIPDYLDRESINWGTLEQLTYTNVSNILPDFCIDSDDIIHLVWQREIDGDFEIIYKKSTDKGLSWSSPLQLTCTPGNLFKPIITSDSGSSLYLVWQAENPVDYSIEIYFKKSSDKGESWSSPTRLTWNQKYSFNPIIRTDNDDNIHLVYSYNDYVCSEIYYKKSTDAGSTWSNPTRLTWLSGDSVVTSFTVDSNSNLYIFWIDDTPGETEVYYKKSTDGGDTWTGATRLTWTNSYCRNTLNGG